MKTKTSKVDFMEGLEAITNESVRDAILLERMGYRHRFRFASTLPVQEDGSRIINLVTVTLYHKGEVVLCETVKPGEESKLYSEFLETIE